jgi:hypothetical protein
MRDLRELNINEMGRPVSRSAPTKGELSELESALGASLPDAYKALLQTANGGHPELNSFVPEGADPESRWSVDVFYYLSSDKTGEGSLWRALGECQQVLRNRCFRYQRMYGQRGLSTEVRYFEGAPLLRGRTPKGSIRLDVVEYGPDGLPTAVYDYKFGAARLSPSRINEIRTGAGLSPDVPVIEVRR